MQKTEAEYSTVSHLENIMALFIMYFRIAIWLFCAPFELKSSRSVILWWNIAWNSCLDFITKEVWRLKSPELNTLDHYVWKIFTDIVQSQRYRRTQGNAANDSLTQGTIDRTVKEFFNDW